MKIYLCKHAFTYNKIKFMNNDQLVCINLELRFSKSSVNSLKSTISTGILCCLIGKIIYEDLQVF